jgi:hypothetical protein
MDQPHPDGLYLLIPGLFGLPRNDLQMQQPARLPALEALLARAERRPEPIRGLETTLFTLFGAETPDEGDLPVAAVTRVLDLGVVDNGWWLRADPVHLAPRRDQLVLSDNHALDLTQDETNGLVAEIMEVYEQDGWMLKAPRPSRWYLKPPRAPKITTTALADVVGSDIHPYLPRGAEAKAWHTTLNELQILLHTAKVNDAREHAGKLAVNSVWFWGGGRLPRLEPTRWKGLWSTEPVSLSLARLSETPSQSTPHDFKEWLRQRTQSGAHMVVLDMLRPAALYRDAVDWMQLMQQLDRHWFEPLFDGLKRRAIPSATLITDTGQSFTIDSRMARRWWRRRHPLAVYQ